MSTEQMDWDGAAEDAKSELTGGELKLEPGESMDVVFLRTLPVEKEVIHFVPAEGGKKAPEDCTGKGCIWCKRAAEAGDDDLKRSVTYRLPVWKVSDKGHADDIGYWKVSRTVMKSVGETIGRYSATHVIEVMREGAGLNSKYKLFPKTPLAATDMPEYERITGTAASHTAHPPTPATGADEAIPF